MEDHLSVLPSQLQTATAMGKLPAAIFIARHGARLDAADKNWHLTSPTPYDPPLSYGGWLQSRALGARIVSLLQSLDTTPPISSTTSLDEPNLPSSLPKPKKRRRIIIHTSPYLRCVQTSIAVSSGISQHYPDTEVVSSAVASSSSPQVNSFANGSPVDLNRESVSTPISTISSISPSLDHRCLLRVDAFLGEWLSPEYFEQIIPPPKSERLITAAKAELLRREDDEVPIADTVTTTPTGHFPGGWSGFTNPVAPSRVDESINQVGPTAAAPLVSGQRNRANSYDSLKSAGTPSGRRILSKINTDLAPIPDGAYMPPTPSYAISSSCPIPIGYVTHARNACVKADYQWDSMRDPQNWGHGGEFGEEWSAMHERFRTGLERMLSWYRDEESIANTGRPRRHSQQPGVQGDVRQDAEEDDTETIVIIITHGAGCNALVGALTGDPVLLDFKTASLTMSVRKEPGDAQNDARAAFLSGKSSVLREYSLRLVASADHLRPHVKPVPSDSTRSSPLSANSAAAPSYRNRFTSRASLSQGQFVIGPSPISGLGSRSWSLVRPSTAPRGSSGLWSSSSLVEESADDILPNFGDRRSISTDAVVTAEKINGDAHPSNGASGWVNPLPALPHRSLSQRGLWGSAPISKEREAGTKRRWTVTERRVDV